MTAVKDNSAKQRFELEIEGHIVFADYRREAETIYITHVEAPAVLRGKGAAGQLMQGMMEILSKQNLKVVPICSYAVAWLARHKN